MVGCGDVTNCNGSLADTRKMKIGIIIANNELDCSTYIPLIISIG